jgi:Skp family chaperone for outer membrane proteins
VKSRSTTIGAIVLGVLTLTTFSKFSQSQTTAPKTAAIVKIAVVAMRDAMLSTKEGQKAGKELQSKFDPQQVALGKTAQELQAGAEQLRKGAATMSAAAQQKLNEDLGAKKKKYDRDLEDLNAEMEAENNRLFQEINGKFAKVLDQYARSNGFSLAMDAEQPVLWAAESVNVTPDMIKAYDQAHPVAGAAPPAAPAGKK